MPFGKKKKDDSQKSVIPGSDNRSSNYSKSSSDEIPHQMTKSKISFQCQLAQGGPTGILSGFRNVIELYKSIANCYDILPEDILFCTLNTHKIDMNNLLGSHIALNDFIFVHVKGQKKEIDICKAEDSLGLTITDNGAGRAFIKRIRESSQISKLGQGLIDVGDHIEKIDNESFVGQRHYDIAKKLRSISIGSKFTLRLISPEKNSIYANLSRRSEYSGINPANIVRGNKTIRINAEKLYEEDTCSSMDELAIERISKLVEKSLGIFDNEMALTILDIGKRSNNPAEFSEQMNIELGEFGFPKTLIHNFWGVLTDAKAGILMSSNSTESTSVNRSSDFSRMGMEAVFEDRL